ncbi:DUF6950 family protein [Amaricoccus solimangrovi]|uniref:DUF6950 domain-containing protein n=1 Tax=Amaricoccus solimangrovi TaxID=2589815 RepID=A0A501WEG1_9RHOB|nr:hypothetical protein [Amaricoccus solimangrovi]TPE47222.1 hypothetical protein FJM51_20420 [Amaricoccus solimangrovi]
MTAIRRRPDWRARLGCYVERVRRSPFAYGGLDCALFAAGAVAAMTGTDLAAEFRDSYTTLTGGVRALRREGYMDHVDMARAHFAEIPPSLAQVGDLAVVQVEDGLALGVVQGARIFLMSVDGLVTVDLLAARVALKV